MEKSKKPLFILAGIGLSFAVSFFLTIYGKPYLENRSLKKKKTNNDDRLVTKIDGLLNDASNLLTKAKA